MVVNLLCVIDLTFMMLEMNGGDAFNIRLKLL